MAQLTNSDLQEFAEVLRLLEEQTPIETPARQDLIQRTASAWLVERQWLRSHTSKR